MDRTLLMIMHEMIQTERDYVRSLEYIIEVSAPSFFSFFFMFFSSFLIFLGFFLGGGSG